ncbi:uncharacterized protein LOC119577522 [Penaeus monodon]|uniref:uncharacterized protein LOC119577522 n=1 Tax=Penaeus monodon TaxID=6687 RepID=UPI0018A74A0E|nr:uncharacterized protein LOC119577522 [Penaeus monodon]
MIVLARGMGLQMAMVGRRLKFHSLPEQFHPRRSTRGGIKNEEAFTVATENHHRSPTQVEGPLQQALKERHNNIPLSTRCPAARSAWPGSPLQEGRHTLSIIWRGQHVVGSPYSVVVDDSQQQVSPGPKRQYLKPLIHGSGEGYHLDAQQESCPVSQSMRGQAGALRFMGILRRRVVRRVVHVGGEDVVLSPDESIGKSSQARQAFQRMRTASNESFDENLIMWNKGYRGRRFSMPPAIDITPPPPSDQGKAEDSYLVHQSGSNWSSGRGPVSHSPILSVDLDENCIEMKCTPHIRGAACESVEDVSDVTSGFPHSVENRDVQDKMRETVSAEQEEIKSPNDCEITNESPEQQRDESGSSNDKTLNEHIMERQQSHSSDDVCAASTEDEGIDGQHTGRKKAANGGKEKSKKKKRERKKKSKGISVNSTQQFGHRCENIINMCDFIIEHSPKKDALRTLEVASHIINYKFAEVSESSYSIPTTETNSNDEKTIVDDENEILETVVDDKGNVLRMSLSSSDSDGDLAKAVDTIAVNDEHVQNDLETYIDLSLDNRLHNFSVECHKELVNEDQNRNMKLASTKMECSETPILNDKEEHEKKLFHDRIGCMHLPEDEVRNNDNSQFSIINSYDLQTNDSLISQTVLEDEPQGDSSQDLEEPPMDMDQERKNIGHNSESLVIPDLVINQDEAQGESDITDSVSDNYVGDSHMDYLQTIDEETEPNSMVDDERYLSEGDMCEQPLEDLQYNSETVNDLSNECQEAEVHTALDKSGETKAALQDTLEFSVEIANKLSAEIERNRETIESLGDQMLSTEDEMEASNMISEVDEEEETEFPENISERLKDHKINNQPPQEDQEPEKLETKLLSVLEEDLSFTRISNLDTLQQSVNEIVREESDINFTNEALDLQNENETVCIGDVGGTSLQRNNTWSPTKDDRSRQVEPLLEKEESLGLCVSDETVETDKNLLNKECHLLEGNNTSVKTEKQREAVLPIPGVIEGWM